MFADIKMKIMLGFGLVLLGFTVFFAYSYWDRGNDLKAAQQEIGRLEVNLRVVQMAAKANADMVQEKREELERTNKLLEERQQAFNDLTKTADKIDKKIKEVVKNDATSRDWSSTSVAPGIVRVLNEAVNDIRTGVSLGDEIPAGKSAAGTNGTSAPVVGNK